MFDYILNRYIISWVENGKIRYFFSEKKKPDIILTDRKDIVVLLKYDKETMVAPIVLDKGRNEYAKKIINTGTNKNVPIVENTELANDLYSTLKPGQSILYQDYEKIANIYSEHTSTNFQKNTNKNYYDEVFEIQRLKEQEKLSISIPEKVKIELSSNIYEIVKNNIFNINILGVLIQNIKLEEDHGHEIDKFCIKVNELPVKYGAIKYSNIDPFAQLEFHLSECLKYYIKEFIGRDEIVYFISQIKEQHPILINEILKYFSIGEIRKVLRDLLEENISIRNIITILETIADFGDCTHDFDIIIEEIRKNLGRDICFPYLVNNNTLKVIYFEYEFEKCINENIICKGGIKMLNKKYHEIIFELISDAAEKLKNEEIKPILICSQTTRKILKNVIKSIDHDFVMISTQEIPNDIKIDLVKEIKSPTYLDKR